MSSKKEYGLKSRVEASQLLVHLMILSGFASPVRAVVVFHESLADSAALAAQFPSVGWVRIVEGSSAFRGTGVLIAPDWVLTAGHNWLGNKVTGLQFDNQGMVYDATPGDWIHHPGWATSPNVSHTQGWDIGLFRLNQSVSGITPASIYTGSAELGSIITLIGAGRAGTHTTGPQANPSATLYAVQNSVDRVITSTSTLSGPGGILAIDFDDGTATRNNLAGSAIYNASGHVLPLAAGLAVLAQSSTEQPLWLEGTSAPGDSGAPAFADFGNGPELVGLVSWGVNPSNPSDPYGSGLGDVTYLTRISAFHDWVYSTIPEPGCLVLIIPGQLILLLTRSRRS